MCEDLVDDNRVCDVRWRPPDITRSLPPQFGQRVTSRSKTRFNRCAHVRGAVGFFVAGTTYDLSLALGASTPGKANQVVPGCWNQCGQTAILGQGAEDASGDARIPFGGIEH